MDLKYIKIHSIYLKDIIKKLYIVDTDVIGYVYYYIYMEKIYF